MNRPSATATRCLLLPALLLPAATGGVLLAQGTVIQAENVRMDYAQVLRVDPVFQVLRATRQEQQCDGKPLPPKSPPSGLSRIVGAVKNALGSPAADGGIAVAAAEDCRMVLVERQFRRPIAFDVDYIYKGMKYRSRLPQDPGNRLRIRVSVTPEIAPAADR